jgi:hypothetical protein
MKCESLCLVREKVKELKPEGRRDLAKDAGVSYSWLMSFTSGDEKNQSDPGFYRVKRLAQHLGLNVCIIDDQ